MQLIWAALAGMVVYLDTTAIAQILICQPIIACPIWGYLIGDTSTGLLIGVIFQLLWLGNLQIGAARFAEGNIGAFIAVALATPGINGLSLSIIPASIIGLLAAHFGSYLAPMVRRAVGRITPDYVLAAEQGNNSRVRHYFLLAVGIHLLAGFLYTLLWLVIGKFLVDAFVHHEFQYWLVRFFDERHVLSSNVTFGLMSAAIGAGCAVAVSVLVRKKTFPLFAGLAVVAFLTCVFVFSDYFSFPLLMGGK